MNSGSIPDMTANHIHRSNRRRAMFKLIHTGDMHYDADKLEDCKTASDAILKSIRETNPQALVIAGDIFNKRQILNIDSAVKAAKETFIEIANLTPTILIKGNQSHDAEGSLELFKNLETKFPTFVTETIDSISLFYSAEKDKYVFRNATVSGDYEWEQKAIFHLFSYPEKGHFLKDKEGLSTDKTNQLVNNEIKKIFLGFAALNDGLTIPKILVFHGNIAGCKLSNGQVLVSQDIIIPSAYFDLAQCDVVCAAHIHAKQEVAKHIWYSGSTYHCNHGETEKKYILQHEIDDTNVRTTEILLPSIPLSQHNVTYNQGTGLIVDEAYQQGELFDTEPDWIGAKLRVRITLTQEQNLVVTDAMIEAKFPGAFGYKIERIVETNDEIRSETIVTANALRDKVNIWMESKSIPVDEEVFALADEVEQKVVTED